jgi:hypothetical protein
MHEVSTGGSVNEELDHARSLGVSVALGGALGAAMGAATGHMGVWVAAGIAAYVAITLVARIGKRNLR